MITMPPRAAHGVRRPARAGLSLAALLGLAMAWPQPTSADGGVGGREGFDDPGIVDRTPAQIASSALRREQVRALLQGVDGGGITPMGLCEDGEPPPCLTPYPASWSLSTHARHQHRFFYCGPAVVQVVSNYTWGYTSTSECGAHCGSGVNKYGQHTISDDWTDTDLHGETYVNDLVIGLNQASIRPPNFIYDTWNNPGWSNFHGTIKVDTWMWRMPLAARLNPKKTGSPYFLYSWRGDPAGAYGHYIVLRGYYGSSQSSALAYYNDSAGGRDEHDTSIILLGDTGAFGDESNTVYQTMKNHPSGTAILFY